MIHRVWGFINSAYLYFLLLSFFAVRVGAIADSVPCAKKLASNKSVVAHPSRFLHETTRISAMGAVVSRFDPELQTRLYFNLSEPDTTGEVPLVSPDAHAVVIYLHGGGTRKASGKNWLDKMQILANSGIASIAPDLPFHSDGPQDLQFHRMDYFMRWLHRLVQKARRFGKPVYFVGHSFGPTPAKEYLVRYPGEIEGGLFISDSGSYHPALTWTYENVTDPGMVFIDPELNESGNEAGSAWIETLDAQVTWPHRPTPPGRIVFMRGEDDEWFPGNRWLPQRLGIVNKYENDPFIVERYLEKKYPDAEFVILPGVGHMLFQSTKNDRNVLIDAVYDLIGTPENLRFTKPREKSNREMVASLYLNNGLFAEWLASKFPHAINTEERARLTLKDWQCFLANNWDSIFKDIPSKYPDFYQQRFISWQRLSASHDTLLENIQKGFGRGEEVQIFQSELERFLEAHEKGESIDLGPDPLVPPPPAIESFILEEGFITKANAVEGPVLREKLVSSLINKGSVLHIIPTRDPHLVKVVYQVEGVIHEKFVWDGVSKEEALKLISQAVLQARLKNQWKIPERWEAQVGPYRLRGTYFGGKITKVAIEPTPKITP